jgi:sulfoquinovosidase
MISIESAVEGFVLLVDGRKVLAHSRRSPCIEIGKAENLVKRVKFSYRLRSRRALRMPLRTFKVVESSDELAIIDFDGRLMMAVRQKEGLVTLSFSRYDSSINHFRIRLVAWPDEWIFGCGERFARLDLKGRRVALWVQDMGIGHGPGLGFLRALAGLSRDSGGDRGATSFPVPAFVSTKGYWCAIDASSYAALDFRRAQTVADFWEVPHEIAIGARHDAPSAVADMNAYIGKSPAAPDWIFEGAWLEARGGTEEMGRRVEAALAAGVRVAALWSRDWCGAAQSRLGPRSVRELSWDRSLYPELPKEIASLRARGMRFIGCATPFLDPAGRLYAEASAAGFCVKSAGGEDYLLTARGLGAAMIDLSSPEALSWLKAELRRGLFDLGMSGILADSGEYLPADAVLASGANAAAAHNRWPLLWAKACREAIDEAGLSADAVLLARSGWFGSGRYVNAFWSGEQLATFSKYDGLPGSVSAAVSLGLSGGGLWHSEAGGSVSFAWARRSSECLERWIEMSAFTPILRVGDGLRPEAAAQVWSDPAALDLLARMSEVYAALKPYHIAVAAEQATRGLPPIRHPWMHYEADPQARRLAYQYLYGRDLMVAPALSPGAGARSGPLTELYLPEDEWVHLWTSRTFRGGQVAVESPRGYPAVFYRAASPFASLFDALRRTARRI